MELVAVDNVVVDGRTYRKGAHDLRRNQGALDSEGDGRNDAELFHQQQMGGPREHVPARKIYYWPQLERIRVEGAGSPILACCPRRPARLRTVRKTRIPGIGR